MIGLFNMSSLGLRAFAGVTVGLLGGVIGIHWSLAISATALLVLAGATLLASASAAGSAGAGLRAAWINPRSRSIGRLEPSRHHDLQELEVVRMAQLGVADAGWLMHAGAGFQKDVADAFVVELDPALQHVHQLEGHVVMVALADGRRAGNRPDHVRNDRAVGGVQDAEVPVFEEGPEPAPHEGRLVGMADRKFHIELLARRWTAMLTPAIRA